MSVDLGRMVPGFQCPSQRPRTVSRCGNPAALPPAEEELASVWQMEERSWNLPAKGTAHRPPNQAEKVMYSLQEPEKGDIPNPNGYRNAVSNYDSADGAVAERGCRAASISRWPCHNGPHILQGEGMAQLWKRAESDRGWN